MRSPRRGEARSYILRKRLWTAETYSNRGNKSLPGKKPIRDYRNDLFVFLVERGAPGNRHSAPRPRMWRPNLFAGHGTPLDGRRALFTLVITPRPVPLRWLASHKLSSTMLSLFRRRRRQPNSLGSLNAFYETVSPFLSLTFFLPVSRSWISRGSRSSATNIDGGPKIARCLDKKVCKWMEKEVKND